MDLLKEIKSFKRTKSSSKKVSILVGSNHSKIIGYVHPAIKTKISDKMKYFPDGAIFSRAFKEKKWDGYIRMFSTRMQTFPTGFLKDVEKILIKFKYKVKINDNRPIIKFNGDPLEPVLDLMRIKRQRARKYQIRAATKAIDLRYGIINIFTGGGKTIIINMIIKAIDEATDYKLNIKVITSGISLISQLREQIRAFQGIYIGMLGGGVNDRGRITVASINTLAERINSNNKKAIKDIRNTDVLFIDEAHHSPAKTFKSVIGLANNVALCIGTTATYKRAETEGDMILKAVTGNIIYKKSISSGIKNGWLAKPTIIIFQYSEDFSEKDIDRKYNKLNRHKKKKKESNTSEYIKSYSVLVANNEHRNQLISKIIKVLDDYNLSSVTFVQSIDQGHLINQKAREFGVQQSVFMKGENKVLDRSKNIQDFKKGRLRHIVCTRIINEGLDFPEANAGIRAGALKYEGTVIQQIGRILRKVKPKLAKDIDRKETQRIFWIDICDVNNRHLASHALERIGTYESEEEFEIVYVDNIDELKGVIDERIKEVKIISKNGKI